MANEDKAPRELDEYDTWFDEDEDDTYAYADEEEEEPTVDDDESDAEDSSPDAEEEDIPDKEDPDESPERADAEGNSKQEGTKEDDLSWVRELDPEFQKRIESLANRANSMSGRAAAEARSKQELQARLDRMQAERDSQRAPTQSTPSQAVPSSEKVADMDDEELKEFMEEYPQVAKSVEKLIEQRTRLTQEEILKQVRPIQQAAEAQRTYENKQALRKEAERIFNTRDTGIDLDTVVQSKRWVDWVSAQPKGYKAFIQNANSVQDAAKVLEDFAAYADREVYAYMEEQGMLQKETQASKADETAARRKEALQGSTPKSRSADTSLDGKGNSYNDWFEKYASGD